MIVSLSKKFRRMALGETSFRRILLSRLLLISVPVLLVGEYVTYRKARSALLETARQNLTESAIRQSESISQSIESLQATLVTASNAVVFKLDSPQENQIFVEQLNQQLSNWLQCVQLINLQNQNLSASTCGDQKIVEVNQNLWLQEQNEVLTSPDDVNIQWVSPSENLEASDERLELLLSAPVYGLDGELRYALVVKSALLRPEKAKRGSLSGFPVVINEARTILAHPYSGRVGRNIQDEDDADRLESVIRGALSGQTDVRHLLSLEKDGVEVLAGYNAISSPVTNEPDQEWIILAVTPLENALSPLKDLRNVLLFMTGGLVLASLVATVYISRELARPLEKLRDYALHTEHLQASGQIPQNFNIREFKQLSEALNEMVERLKAWGEEIVSAWKEAQNANKLKNEFLATTSHELRTPLNGIINCVKIVKDGYCDSREEELEFLRQADDAAVHLLGIINDVLDISKIEAGKLSVQIEKVNLQKILDEVIDLQTIPIRKKGLEFKTPDWQQEITVYADPAKLKQVLINIVGNAVKFTEVGKIAISLRIEEESRKNALPQNLELDYHSLDLSLQLQPSYDSKVSKSTNKSNGFNAQDKENSAHLSQSQNIVITVRDTGIGIDPGQQSRLFRPFAMVDGSTTRKFGGTGLGLAISRNLIELMGGKISLFSKGKGLGTTVEVSLPLLGPFFVSEDEAENLHNGRKIIIEKEIHQ